MNEFHNPAKNNDRRKKHTPHLNDKPLLENGHFVPKFVDGFGKTVLRCNLFLKGFTERLRHSFSLFLAELSLFG